MKTTEVRDRAMAPVNFRSAWLIRRACSPIWLSPMSPSISAFGTRAATESMTMTSTAPDRAHSDRRVQIDRARRNGFDPDSVLRAEPHDGALPAALLDLRDGQVQGLLLIFNNRRHSHVVIRPLS